MERVMVGISIKMQRIAEKLAKKHGIDLYEDEEAHLRLDMVGYDSLVIERYCDEPICISVAHYFEMNGDLVSDPQIEFLVKDDLWVPVSIEQFLGGYRRCVEIDSTTGNAGVTDRSNQRDLAAFADMWAENIMDQGWLERAKLHQRA